MLLEMTRDVDCRDTRGRFHLQKVKLECVERYLLAIRESIFVLPRLMQYVHASSHRGAYYLAVVSEIS